MSDKFTVAKHVYDEAVEGCTESNKAVNSARKRLYVSSSITLVVFITNAIPTRIEPLGIDLATFQAGSIMPLLSLVSAYFLLLFVSSELEYQGARVDYIYAKKQWNKLVDLKDASTRTLSQKSKLLLGAGEAGGSIAQVVLVAVPILMGSMASLVGFVPSWFGWLKHFFAAQAVT